MVDRAMSEIATGRQPIIVWKCSNCGRVNREEWMSGSHMQLGGSDATDPEQRCYGQAEGPFYLLSRDEYLDVMLAAPPPESEEGGK